MALALIVIATLYFFTAVSPTLLFWAAFILTRPSRRYDREFL